jgi:hypothetical protein
MLNHLSETCASQPQSHLPDETQPYKMAALVQAAPQAAPHWQAIASEFAVAWVIDKLPFDYDAAAAALANTTSVSPVNSADPRISEDCLVLDVIVPQSVFESTENGSQHKGIPVLVWIYVRIRRLSISLSLHTLESFPVPDASNFVV